MLTSTPGRGRGMTVDVYYDSDKPHQRAELSSTSSEESPVKLAANFASYESSNGQHSPQAVYRMEPLSPPAAQQQWQQQHSLLPQHKHILLQHHQSQQQQQQEFIMLQQQQQQQQFREDVGYQQQHQQLQEFQIQKQAYQPYPSLQNKSPQQASFGDTFKQIQQHDQQETPHRPQPHLLKTSKQQHNQMTPNSNSHPQQIRILQRPPQQQQLQQQGREQQLQQQGREQQLQQQGHQQQQSTTSPPQISFPGMVAPSLFPSNISPMDLTSFIDTSVPPPPIGVPIPGLHFPVSAKSPPLRYPTTTAFHTQPPHPAKPCEPSPQQPKTSPDPAPAHRSQPVKWKPDANGDLGSRYPTTTAFHTQPPHPAKPCEPSPQQPKTSLDPPPAHRSQPVKWKPDANGDLGSTFTSIQDSPWDSIELGGGYASPVSMDTVVGLRGPSPVFVPKAANLPPSQGPSQNGHFQTKRTSGQTRDAAEGPKQWIQRNKAKGRGIPKKDIKVASAGQHPKPHQGHNVFPQGYGAAPNGMNSSHQGQGSTRQQQDASKSALQLSKEQKKNEYEWQSFKIIRKVRKLLGGLKEDAGKEKEIAAEIVGVLQAESSRLACFPWPKEQFVALDEIFGWVMDNSELLDKTCKVVQELHCLHPQNFQEDLLNTIMKRQSQYIKVSTATNKEKLYTTFCGLLTKLFILSRSATNGLNKIIDKMLDSIVNKWITCDVQETADDPALLTEVYASCLSVLFVNIGPQLASSMDQRYYKLLRDQVLGGKPRFVKEAMLNLLLLRAAEWQEEAFTKKNVFPEDLKEVPNTAQQCRTTGEEGTEVSDEVTKTEEALQLVSVTTKSEDLTKTDQTRPSVEMAGSSDEVVSSVTPKTQPDNLQPGTAISSPASHSSNNNNSNSIQGGTACPQNFTNGMKIRTLQPQDRPQSMQTKPTSDVWKCLPLDNLQSNGTEDAKPLSSSTDIYGPPYTSEDAAFYNSNDIPNAYSTNLQQERKPSSPSRVAGTAAKPRSSPATGRGMMRFEQSLTSPLAFIQSGPPQDAAFKRYDSERLEKETTTDQVSRDYSAELVQNATVCPKQDSKPAFTLKLSQDRCEDGPDYMESFSGTDGTATEDFGKLVNWSNPTHSQESFEEINDEYFASQGESSRQFEQVNPDESNDQESTKGEQQTLFTAGEAVSEEKRDEEGLGGSVSSDEDLGCQDPLASSSNIPPEDSNKKPASMVSDKTPAGLGQYERIESTTAPGQPASPQVSNCSLCGSDKHRTRQCATFKKYAPHVKTSDCEPETTETPQDDVQKPNTEKFGSIIFCSKCGQKGHLVYDCHIKGSFNIFK